MPPTRTYRDFTHKDAVLRICCDRFEAVTAEIVTQRRILEDYLLRHKAFGKSFEPVAPLLDAPEIARRMASAAKAIGVGPMAAVAGAMAQISAEAGLAANAAEAIVENGGDIFLKINSPAVVGLHAGSAGPGDQLAFSLQPNHTPLAICSSSGKMGHSTSLGQCDLAVCVSKDAAMADAAATLAANLVKQVEDVDAALEKISGIQGIDGVLIVKNDRVGLAGDLPELVKNPT